MEQPWWDERFAFQDLESEEDARVGPHIATVDLEDEYLRDIVIQAFCRHPKWQVFDASIDQEPSWTPACSTLHWGEYEGIDWERVQAGDLIASSYCIRKGLIRKAHLAHNLKKWNAKYPSGRLVRAVPETLIMVLDDIEYFDEALSDVYEVRDMEEGSQTWIAKPSLTNQALEICIFDRVSTLRAALEANPDLREWVLQRYIENPLLVGGKKFHIRTYVLCVGSLACYVFSDMLALFAREPYRHGNDHLSELSAHLTNTCRLAGEGTAVPEAETVKLVSELAEMLQSLQTEGMELGEVEARLESLHQDILDIVGSCIEAVSSELTFFTLPNCFELFGFDFLVDETWNVWLLEANAEPDMKQTGERLKGIISNLVHGALDLVLQSQVLQKVEQQQYNNYANALASGIWVKVFEKRQRA